MAEISEVIEKMVEIRDRMDRRRKEYEAQRAKDKEAWAKGEAWLMARMEAQGVTNVATTSHTVYTSDQMMASVGDHESLRQHILNTGDVDLLEKRVSNKAVKEYMENNEGELPPGVKTYTKRSINIRKK